MGSISYSKNAIYFALIFFHLLARKPNLEKFYIYSNKFFHNFQLSESSFACPGLRASWLAQRLLFKIMQLILGQKKKCISYVDS